jgi:hypothetical protein
MFIDLSWQIHKSGGLLVDSIYIVDIRGKTKKKGNCWIMRLGVSEMFKGLL